AGGASDRAGGGIDPRVVTVNVRSSRTRRISGALAGRDVACPKCGYNLRGLKQGQCPECGREIEWSDIPGNERPMRWLIHAFDLVGLGITIALNGTLVGF